MLAYYRPLAVGMHRNKGSELNELMYYYNPYYQLVLEQFILYVLHKRRRNLLWLNIKVKSLMQSQDI
jgi:hypothetical protein